MWNSTLWSIAVSGIASKNLFTMVVDVLFSEPRFEEPETWFLDGIPPTLLDDFPFNTVLYQIIRQIRHTYKLYQKSNTPTKRGCDRNKVSDHTTSDKNLKITDSNREIISVKCCGWEIQAIQSRGYKPPHRAEKDENKKSCNKTLSKPKH